MLNTCIFASNKMKEQVQYIYTLSCPIENEIIYVGQTWNLKGRLFAHCHSGKKSKIANRILQIKDFGLKPVFELLDTVPISEAYFWEVYYINQFKHWGIDLLNTHRKYKKALI